MLRIASLAVRCIVSLPPVVSRASTHASFLPPSHQPGPLLVGVSSCVFPSSVIAPLFPPHFSFSLARSFFSVLPRSLNGCMATLYFPHHLILLFLFLPFAYIGQARVPLWSLLPGHTAALLLIASASSFVASHPSLVLLTFLSHLWYSWPLPHFWVSAHSPHLTDLVYFSFTRGARQSLAFLLHPGFLFPTQLDLRGPSLFFSASLTLFLTSSLCAPSLRGSQPWCRFLLGMGLGSPFPSFLFYLFYR